MTSPDAMPAWPVPYKQAIVTYQRALAAAWQARCRLAVDALEEIRKGNDSPRTTAMVAIAAIGPLPEEAK